jgi:hypothetical protein
LFLGRRETWLPEGADCVCVEGDEFFELDVLDAEILDQGGEDALDALD